MHPLIKGEYIRTNSSNGQLLKQRLLKRQFPHQLIERSIRLVKYTDRQKYLKEPTQSISLSPLLLPQSHRRFIALRHKTIGQELTHHDHQKRHLRLHQSAGKLAHNLVTTQDAALKTTSAVLPLEEPTLFATHFHVFPEISSI